MKKTKNKLLELERDITMLIHTFCVPTKLKGYNFLREAILIMVMNGGGLNMTTHIYPKVAEVYNSTPYRVERDIRTAITASWKNNDMAGAKAFAKRYQFATLYTERPSNGEYISIVADELLIKYSLELANKTRDFSRNSLIRS